MDDDDDPPHIVAWCAPHDPDLWREHSWVARVLLSQAADIDGEVREQLRIWLVDIDDDEEEYADALQLPCPPSGVRAEDIGVCDSGPHGMSSGLLRLGFWLAHPRVKYAAVDAKADGWAVKLWLDRKKAN